MKQIVLQLEQFTPICGPNMRWSEMLIKGLLELVVFANAVMLKCNPNILPMYEYARRGKIKYIRQPNGSSVEKFVGIPTVLEQGGGDCFPEGTWLLKRGSKIVPIESIDVGDEIWGLNDWTRVEAKADKGKLRVDRIALNNHEDVELTPDHHVYVMLCPKHGQVRHDGTHADRCTCPIEQRVEHRIEVRHLSEGSVLAQPKTQPTIEHGSICYRPNMIRVQHIIRGLTIRSCWDIQTSDHRVYLPEHDVTVSNCDQLVGWRVAELRVRGSPYYPNGEPAKLKLIRFDRPGKALLYHVIVERAPTPQYPHGWIEDPSRRLGMKGAA